MIFDYESIDIKRFVYKSRFSEKLHKNINFSKPCPAVYRSNEVFLLIIFLKHSLFKILKNGNVGNIIENNSDYFEKNSTSAGC